MPATLEREAHLQATNPLGLEGIEFIEFATPRPQALGQALELMGFRPVARHRSREVLLYRQGGMNVIVNAHGVAPDADAPVIAALALRVRDAARAWNDAVARGAWPLPVAVQPMELLIPGIHGVGTSRIYFVDRWREFSIYDVDFVPIPTVAPVVPATAGLHWFGLVQYIGHGRTADWVAFYRELFGLQPLPATQRLGILPAGQVLASPCGTFWLQLVEPAPGADEPDEALQRLAFGAPDVPAAVQALALRGVPFVADGHLQAGARGALTQELLPGLMFELVQHAAA